MPADVAFILPARATFAVVGAQTVVLAVGQAAGGEDATNVLATTAMFGGFQLFAALMAITALRETRPAPSWPR